MDQLRIPDAGASCGLDEEGAARRNAEFADVVERGLRDREHIAGRVRLSFERKQGLEEDLRELARRESHCCGFLGFDLTVGEHDIVLVVDAPADKAGYLQALYRATVPPHRSRPRKTLGGGADDEEGPAPHG